MAIRCALSRCWRRSFALLVGAAILQALILAFSSSESLVSKPAQPGTALNPIPIPVYSEVVPATNPVRFCLQDDGRKVLGWVSGGIDFTGRLVSVRVGGKLREEFKIEAGNTFAWDYGFDKPTEVAFDVLPGRAERMRLHESLTVTPAAAEKEPSVFFIVDRTAYRPAQPLNFAGFLRRLNARGDFEPIANSDVDVELVSQQKHTKIFKARLQSDANGKLGGSYTFSDSDPLDTYTLRIPGFKGEAKLLLGEYRKSKVRLKISGEITDDKLELKFETIDFLDRPVRASKLSFKAQVIEKQTAQTSHALKAEEFAYFTPINPAAFDLDDLSEDDRLLWVVENAAPHGWVGRETHIVANVSHDLALNGTAPGRYTIDLKKEWLQRQYSVVVEATVTDANGREQRGTYTVSLTGATPAATTRLELAKDSYAAGERIVTRLTGENGKPVGVPASLVVMKLSPAPSGNNVNAIDNRLPAQGPWTLVDSRESAKHRLVTALPFQNGLAAVKLAEPGAYRLIAVMKHNDGRTTQTETGCIVKHSAELTPFFVKLTSDNLNTGDNLKGAICSRFANARVLLTLRDSSGLRFWKPFDLNENGIARLDEKLPRDLKFGCTLDLHYPGDDGVNHVVSRLVRVNPYGRVIGVTAKLKEEVKPGEQVKIDLQVDRPEEVDLVVSVYDQSLLGINPDKSIDIRNFYLADERVRQMQAADLVRRKLSNVTIGTLLAKADAFLNGNSQPSYQVTMARLKRLVQHVRDEKRLDSEDMVDLMRLGGVDVRMNPFWQAYFHRGWSFAFGGNLKMPLRDVVNFKNGDFSLVIDIAGDALVLREMHPQWANVDPKTQWNNVPRFGGFQMGGIGGFHIGGGIGGIGGFQIGGFGGIGGIGSGIGGIGGGIGGFGGAAGGLPLGGGMGGIGGGFQGGFSHLPLGGAPIQLIKADPDQGHIDVRRDFSDLAFWKADVRTDRAGHAQVEFKAPDSLTNWQVVVTAVSNRMHVGQTTSTFRTFKPVMIVPMLPRSFTEGDVVKLFGSVLNHTNKAQTFKVRLKVENGKVLTPEEQTVTVKAKSSENVYWNFRAQQSGFTQLLMSADCAGGADASLKRLPVGRAVAEQVVTKSGQVKNNGTTFTIPKDVDLKSARLEISFAPSLAADMADTLNYLVEYPYGCVEQTMSRFLPAIRVAQILKQYRVDHPELNQKLPGCVAGGIKRLLELQQPDGGWGWQDGSKTHEMMTPYALYGLLEAEKAGYAIPNETAIQRGLGRLRTFIDAMNEHQAADRIYCMYVYTHREELLADWVRFLERMQQSGRLSDYANALCLSMCVDHNQLDLAKKFAGDLRAKAQKGPGGQISWKTAGFSRWAEDPHEITAAAMRAIVAFDKDDPLIDGILAYFAASKRGDRWNSTKDTATILLAMCDYLAKVQIGPDGIGELSFTVNGGKAQELNFADKLTKKVTIEGENVKNGDNKLSFTTTAPGVMYRAVLRYWKAGRDADAMDEGIQVDRKFFLWDEKSKRIGKELHNGDTIARGSYVFCDTTATLDQQGDMRYMLMDSPKPATAEIVPVDDVRFASFQLKTGYALREERLSSVAFHHEQAPRTVCNRVIMLAELTSDYVVAPAFVELMYQTETRGHSGTFRLKVKE